MERRRYIRDHKDFKDNEKAKVITYVGYLLRKGESIIEISQWDDKTRERK